MRSTILFLFAGGSGLFGGPALPTAATLDKLPIVYETNLGQAAPEVRYLSRGSQFSLALTDTAAHLALPGREELRLEWEGATPQPSIYGQWETGGASSYFRGDDPSRWKGGARHYGRVRYASLYPGIDLVFYGAQRRPEFDFIVAPHADPSVIRIRVHGARKLQITRDGELNIAVGKGEVRLGAPVIYQPCASGACPVAGRYRITDKNLLTFVVGDYDRELPLVIDPVLVATYLGGSGADIVSAVAVDFSGSVYVTGYTTSTNVPLVGTPVKATLTPGDADLFVIKLNPGMTTVLYATYIGGEFNDYGRAIAIDTTGAAYLTGSTIGRFPFTPGAFRVQSAASPAIFVTKLNPAGNALVYSTYLDGAGSGQGIAVDSAQQAYITGWTYTATFSTTPGALQRNYMGNSDAFVVKLNSAGSVQLYSTFLGGSEEDQARDIAINSDGDAFITGFTSSSNFPTNNAIIAAYRGSTDAFVTRLNSAGNSLVYSTYLGGTNIDRAFAISIDPASSVYIAGQTMSTGFPVSTASTPYQSALAGAADAFVTKLTNTGALSYSTYLGGTGSCSFNDPFQSYRCDAAFGIRVNNDGDVLVTGVAGPAFPLVGATQTNPGGNGDAFLAQLNTTGSTLIYSTYLGGSQPDAGLALAVSGGTTFLGGFTSSTNLPQTSGAPYPTARGGVHDGLLARYGECPAIFLSSGSNFPATSGTFGPIDVSATPNCTWSIVNFSSWVTVNNPSGTGPGQFTVTLAANPGCQRFGFLQLPGGALYAITQAQSLCARFAVGQSWYPAAGGTFQVSILANTSWQVSSTVPWASLSQPTAGNGDGFVTFVLAPNTGAARRTFLTLASGGTFAIDQVGGASPLTCSYTLSPGEQVVPAEGTSSSFLVTTQGDCGWTATSTVSWVTVTSSSGTGEGIVGYEVARNTTGQTRVAALNVAGRTFTITQSAQ